jgi:hypothetical protein
LLLVLGVLSLIIAVVFLLNPFPFVALCGTFLSYPGCYFMILNGYESWLAFLFIITFCFMGAGFWILLTEKATEKKDERVEWTGG